LRGLQRRSALLVSEVLERIAVALLRSERRPDLRRLLLGTLAAANLRSLKPVSHKTRRSPVHLGSKKDKGEDKTLIQLNWTGVLREEGAAKGPRKTTKAA